MKKRIISLLLAFAMMTAMVPQVATEARAVQSGTCGDNLTWTLDDEGMLTISGTGAMEDYDYDYKIPWIGYRDSIYSIIIVDGVTSISDNVFSGCNNLTSVTIPNSVTSIGFGTFFSCDNLITVTIPNSVTYIGRQAFELCVSLTNVTIPNSVTYIGDRAFYDCDSLTTVTIPNGVKSIGRVAFGHCDNLTTVTIPSSVTKIGDHPFSDCVNLTGIWVDENNPSYSSDAAGVLFDKDQTKMIEVPCAISGTYAIPSSVTSIDDRAFNSCRYLTGVRIPSSVTSIGFFAFSNCTNLISVTIPSSVTFIDEGAFYLCTRLTHVYYTGTEGQWDAIYIDYYNDWLTNATIHFGSEMPTEPGISGPFTDVPPDSFYYPPVLWALENGITTGATATTFNPNGQCLRAHVVTFLHRADGNPAPTSSNNPFTDVKSSDFFYKPVLWAVEQGITNGVSTTAFGSYDVCNRAAVVTFLWRAAGSPEPQSTENPFADVKSGDFFYKPVLWAVENHITNGIDATHFGPDTPCNRAQVVTFLYRTYN